MGDPDPSAAVPEDESDAEPMVGENIFQDVGTWLAHFYPRRVTSGTSF